MDIFIIEKDRVVPTPESLMIHPFSEIWEKNEKPVAMQKLSYIEFMCSRKKSNPFIDYKENEKQDKILQSISPNAEENQLREITEDTLVKQAMEIYEEIQKKSSPSLRFYEAALKAANEMVEFFTNFDLSATNARTGHLLYKPADITRALKDVNDVLRTLGGLKTKVIQELYEDSKGKGGRDINHFEKSKVER